MRTFKDTDIRDALQRKFADAPQVPADLSERVMQRLQKREEPTPMRRKLSVALRWMAAAAVVVAVVVWFTWKDFMPQTPMKSGETTMSLVEQKDAPKDTLKRRTRGLPSPHAGIAIAARGNDQRRTRRLQPPQQPLKNEAKAKGKDTPPEPEIAEVEMLPMQGQIPSADAGREAQEIRQRGEQVEQYVAMLNERVQPEQIYVEY